MDADQLLRKISKWANMLENDEKIGHAIRRLEAVEINLHLLSSTGVGKSVNALRKHPSWGDRAASLVSRWKEVARAETAAVAIAEEQKDDEKSGSEDGDSSRSCSVRELKFVDNSVAEATNGHVTHTYISTAIKKKAAPQIISNSKKQHCAQKVKAKQEEIVDAFSAQLAAADHVPNVKTSQKKKFPKFSHETIQNSLKNSLENGIFPQVSQHSQPVHQKHVQLKPTPSLDINMFKKPKDNRRVYAGRKKNATQMDNQVPRLFDICIRVLLANIDAIEETGDIPYFVLKPVLEKATAAQLIRIEEINTYLQEDSEELWQVHCEREFSKELLDILCEESEEEEEEEEREDEESGEDEETRRNRKRKVVYYFNDGCSNYRERYFKLSREREHKLKNLSRKIKSKASELTEPQRKAMVTAPIAPRHIRKRQIRSGMVVSANLVPSAVDLTRARRQIFETGNDADLRQMPSAIRNTTSRLGAHSSSSDVATATLATKRKPQRGPLMMKTLKMLKKQRH